MRLEVFTATKIQVAVFWVVTPENGGSMVLQNVGILPYYYTVHNPEDGNSNVDDTFYRLMSVSHE